MALGIDTETHMLESAQDGQRILAGINGDAASSVRWLISEYTELRDRVKVLVDGLPQHHTDPELCDACTALMAMCPYHTGRADSWAYLSQAMRLVASGDSGYAVLVLEHADANGDEA
ncbi:hypothetical protein ACFY6U_50520 [Streptomyces sp. NPDC013157]|uniref:hypothetical protein n=1 Tax=Streptomyces sp. NPDC013157 TaxID=3364861 RepID=UPI0036B60CDE